MSWLYCENVCVNLQFSVPPLGGEEYLKMSNHVTFNSLFLLLKVKKKSNFQFRSFSSYVPCKSLNEIKKDCLDLKDHEQIFQYRIQIFINKLVIKQKWVAFDCSFSAVFHSLKIENKDNKAWFFTSKNFSSSICVCKTRVRHFPPGELIILGIPFILASRHQFSACCVKQKISIQF